jgi:glycerol-3-phosphate acyltransferase PlsY
MSTAKVVAISALGGYLVGSMNFSRVVGERAAPGQDLNITEIEVPEAGTTIEFHGTTPTSIKEHAGTKAAMLSVALEAAKAAGPTLAARLLLPGTPAAPAAATGAVIGHILPVWTGFRRGGYGMSPMLGGMLVLDPVGLAATTTAVSGIIQATGDRRLMMIWPVTVPAWEAARGRRELVAFGLITNTAYWARLLPEFRRGLRGLFGSKGRSGGDDVAPGEPDDAEGAEHQAE